MKAAALAQPIRGAGVRCHGVGGVLITQYFHRKIKKNV